MHVIMAVQEQTRHLPAPPIVFGIIVFALLQLMMVGLLMFGKGRPHS
jgi:hypothetical protein